MPNAMLRGEVLGNTELRVDGRGAKDKLSQTPKSANDTTTAAVTDDQHGWKITIVMFILPWGSSLALALSVVLAKNFIGLLFSKWYGRCQKNTADRRPPTAATKIHL